MARIAEITSSLKNENKKKKVRELPSGVAYNPTPASEFPDDYYVGPAAPADDAEDGSPSVFGKFIPGTTLWFDTSYDVVRRWDGKNWCIDSMAPKWVIDRDTGDPLGVIPMTPSKSEDTPSLTALLDAEID